MTDSLRRLLAGAPVPRVVYMVLVLLGGALLLQLILRALQEATAWRMRRLKKRQIEDPIPAATEPTHKLPSLQEIARRSIENQFTVTRRLVPPLVLGITGVALLMPFLDYVPAATLSLVVGATTVLLGMAARPVVENAFSGLVISFSRTLNLGDTVRIDGHYGTVEDIGMTHTTIKRWDWRRYVVPNSRMLNSEFLNYTLIDGWVWAYVEFWVSLDADFAEVEQIVVGAFTRSEALGDTREPPGFWVLGMDKDAVRCWGAAWAESPGDAWTLASDARRAIATGFSKAGIRGHGFHLELSKDREAALARATQEGIVSS